MQQHHVDASSKVHSLDDVYFYAGHEIPKRIAIMDHKSMAPGEIDLVTGDLIQFAGNHWNGFSKVSHTGVQPQQTLILTNAGKTQKS